MSLRDQKDPIVSVREEKRETKRVTWVEDNKVVRNLNDRATGHISHDNSLYTDRMSHHLASMWTM